VYYLDAGHATLLRRLIRYSVPPNNTDCDAPYRSLLYYNFNVDWVKRSDWQCRCTGRPTESVFSQSCAYPVSIEAKPIDAVPSWWRRAEWMTSLLYSLWPGNSPTRFIKLSMTAVAVIVVAMTVVTATPRFGVVRLFIYSLLFRSRHLRGKRCGRDDDVVNLSR